MNIETLLSFVTNSFPWCLRVSYQLCNSDIHTLLLGTPLVGISMVHYHEICLCMYGHTGYKTTSLFFSVNVMYAMEGINRQRFFAIFTWKFSIWGRGYMTASAAHMCGYNWAITMGLQLQGYIFWVEPSLNLQLLSQPYQPIPSIPMVEVGHQSTLNCDRKYQPQNACYSSIASFCVYIHVHTLCTPMLALWLLSHLRLVHSLSSCQISVIHVIISREYNILVLTT